MKTSCIALRSGWMLLLIALLFSQKTTAQEEYENIFFKITKLKKMSDDFLAVQEELFEPLIQERIKQGTQLAHALCRVHYPNSENAEYEYVAVDVFQTFEHLHMEKEEKGAIAHAAFPNADIPKMIERYKAAGKKVSSEIYVIRDEAFPGPQGGNGKKPRFIQVNHMKVSEANSMAYANVEGEIFKPIHQKRAEEGQLHDWILLQRLMPYGSEWDDTFLTFDMFSEWKDIGNQMDMGQAFAQVHPDKDMEATFQKMASLRDLRRTETWELLSYTDSPTPVVTYNMVKEGNGPSPTNGQEVTWRGTMRDTEGKILFQTASLGFDFNSIVGENPYDRFFDRGIRQMKKGGVLKITVPPGIQDKMAARLSGGVTAVMEIELLDFGQPEPNGALWLKDLIDTRGLEEAMKAYHSHPKDYIFREGDMNVLGYQLIEEGHHDGGIFIFEANQENYPESWNACDSLADGYQAAGNKAEAKKWYQKAIEINPDFQGAKDKLAKMN